MGKECGGFAGLNEELEGCNCEGRRRRGGLGEIGPF